MALTPVVKPAGIAGFQDWLPADMRAWQRMVDIIRAVYERFGFDQLRTPAIERSDVLGTDQADFSFPVYRFKTRGRNRAAQFVDDPAELDAFADRSLDMTLRFDLTVPLSRIYAAYANQLPSPFRRFQIAQVWRREKAQAGRFCEFTQADGDIVGTASMLADAEIISLIIAMMTALDVGPFVVRFNHRKILNGLPEYAGFDRALLKSVLRTIDKIDKEGPDKIRWYLTTPPTVDELGIGLSADAVDRVMAFLTLSAVTDPAILFAELAKVFAAVPMGMDGTAELQQIASYLGPSTDTSPWRIDLSVARGLDYYTGPVFETMLVQQPDFGSVMSGGRFDDLVMRFTGHRVPATGASVGVDRLFAALRQIDRIPATTYANTQVLVANWDDEHAATRFQLVGALRAAGLTAEIHYDAVMLRDQLAYALKRGTRFVIFAGARELAGGVVSVKDLTKAVQVDGVPLDKLPAMIYAGLAEKV